MRLLLQNSDTFFDDETEVRVFPDVSSGYSWEIAAGSLSPFLHLSGFVPSSSLSHPFCILPSGPGRPPPPLGAALPTEGGPLRKSDPVPLQPQFS